ncbi:hypothetical protein PTI98_010687 [Pleurotus ostreatus]|nr:hypothetical protein PTI98_010687 [Pleurotus ostreatus]
MNLNLIRNPSKLIMHVRRIESKWFAQPSKVCFLPLFDIPPSSRRLPLAPTTNNNDNDNCALLYIIRNINTHRTFSLPFSVSISLCVSLLDSSIHVDICVRSLRSSFIHYNDLSLTHDLAAAAAIFNM